MVECVMANQTGEKKLEKTLREPMTFVYALTPALVMNIS